MGNGNGLIGRLVAGAGGAALVVSVFLSWYSLSLADVLHAAASRLPAQASAALSTALAQLGGLTLTSSGWHAVHAIRFVLLLVGIAVLVNAISASNTLRERRASFVLAGGLLAAVLVAYRIQSPPGALDVSVGPFQFQSPAGTTAALTDLLRVHVGPWVALIGSALVMVGGWLELRSGPTMVAVPAPAMPIASASKPPPGS